MQYLPSHAVTCAARVTEPSAGASNEVDGKGTSWMPTKTLRSSGLAAPGVFPQNFTSQTSTVAPLSGLDSLISYHSGDDEDEQSIDHVPFEASCVPRLPEWRRSVCLGNLLTKQTGDSTLSTPRSPRGRRAVPSLQRQKPCDFEGASQWTVKNSLPSDLLDFTGARSLRSMASPGEALMRLCGRKRDSAGHLEISPDAGVPSLPHFSSLDRKFNWFGRSAADGGREVSSARGSRKGAPGFASGLLKFVSLPSLLIDRFETEAENIQTSNDSFGSGSQISNGPSPESWTPSPSPKGKALEKKQSKRSERLPPTLFFPSAEEEQEVELERSLAQRPMTAGSDTRRDFGLCTGDRREARSDISVGGWEDWELPLQPLLQPAHNGPEPRLGLPIYDPMVGRPSHGRCTSAHLQQSTEAFTERETLSDDETVWEKPVLLRQDAFEL